MKVQVNRAFKGRQAVYAIFFNLQYKCAEVRQSPISKPTSSFSVADPPSFIKEHLNP